MFMVQPSDWSNPGWTDPSSLFKQLAQQKENWKSILIIQFSLQFASTGVSFNKEIYPLFVTMQVIPAALAAASPMALSSTTTQLRNKFGKKKNQISSQTYISKMSVKQKRI